MVRVNRHQLSHKDQDMLLGQFDAVLTSCGKEVSSQFLNELLGKEERLTIAKRFMAIVLMYEGYSEYKTSKLLKLSPTTTGIIAEKMQSDGYTHIIARLTKKKKGYSELLDTLDSLLHLGGFLPRRVGLDRYRSHSERIQARREHKL